MTEPASSVFRIDRANWLGTSPLFHGSFATTPTTVTAPATATTPDGVGDIAVFAVPRRRWESVRRRGIQRVRRSHIELFFEGMHRHGAREGELYVHVDLDAARRRGASFERASSGVVRTKHDIPTACFLRVLDGVTSVQLWP